MSNRYQLCRQTRIDVKDNISTLYLVISDDFGEDSYIVDSFPDDDLECLEICITQQKEEQYRSNEVLDGLFESQKGIDIDNTWYDHDEISHLFDKWGEEEEEEEEEDTDKEIEILKHTILYNFEDGSTIDDCTREQIEYMIGQGFSEGELNQEEKTGYWKIKK